MAVQIIGSFAFECARSLAREKHGIPQALRLSPRQHDCLLLAAQGKSDWEIGHILGLSEETVTKYMNAARARYGVSRRMQLAIRALLEGELSFAEIVSR